MKIKQSILVFIIGSILLVSCTSDDNGITETPAETTIRLVKSERVNDNFKTEYSYDSKNRIVSFNGIYPNVTFESIVSYDSNNRLTQELFQLLSPTTSNDTQSFSYNSNGLLMGYTAGTESVSISYNGNIVSLSGTIEGDENSQAELELNDDGLIVKFIKDSRYTDLMYDSNGNIISTKTYSNSGNLLFEFTIQYDNKINPFYGQYKSIYIERFIEWFWEFDGIYFSGLEGYGFPFLKNNIISISDDTNIIKEYDYTYDNQDYPTNVVETSNGSIFEYEIEYFE